MKEVIVQNWFLIVLSLIVFVVIPLYLIINRKWKGLRMYALTLIHAAEVRLGSKQGQEKFNFVLEQLYYGAVPVYLRPFITKAMVAKELQNLFDRVKILLEYSPK